MAQPLTLEKLEELIENNNNIENVNTSEITNMSGLFKGSRDYPNFFNQPLNDWDVSNVTDMGSMFSNAVKFNQPLNNWDVSNVSDMHGMFNCAESFNQPLNNWDVSNVSDMGAMFQCAKNFNQSLNKWNVSNVTRAWFMFNGATKYKGSMKKWYFKKMLSIPIGFMTNCIAWEMYNSIDDMPLINGERMVVYDYSCSNIWHEF